MKENKPKRSELHVIIDPKLLERLRIDAVERGLRTGQLVSIILEDFYKK